MPSIRLLRRGAWRTADPISTTKPPGPESSRSACSFAASAEGSGEGGRYTGRGPEVMSLATYFLVNDGGDFVNGVNQTPSAWWSGFDVALGAAYGSRQRSSSGAWTRQFSGGEAITVEPGASTQTIRLGKRMHSAEWGTVESVTLSAGQGAVLVG